MAFDINQISEQEVAVQQSREIHVQSEYAGRLFHYTSLAGMHGIIEKCALWATHASYLNDSQEMTFGLDFLLEIMKMQTPPPRIVSKETDDDGEPVVTTNMIMQAVHGMIRARVVDEQDDLLTKYVPFVACLTRSPDQLSQWRGYSTGGGYCVEFDEESLVRTMRQVTQNGVNVAGSPALSLAKVMYATPEASIAIRDRVQSYIPDLIEELKKMREGDPPGKFPKEMRDWLIKIVSTIKQPSFGEELEYRILGMVDETFVSESSVGLIPRTAFGFDPDAIQEIMVGPGSNSELKENSLRRYLRNRGSDFSHIKVTTSKNSFREI